MSKEKLIALFPEASFGAALNCIGIAQALRELGARPVFICHAHFQGIFAEYGFAEYPIPQTNPLSAAEHQHYWERFIERNIPYFDQTPLEQIDSYVAPAWEAIIDTAIEAEKPLQQLLARLKPDVIVLDNEGFHSELLGYRMSTDKEYVPIILKFSSESVLFVSTLTIAL